MSEKVDLLEEIQKVHPKSQILIATYEYSQQFFEKEILPIFKDKTLPIILVDYNEYQRNALNFGKSKLAGRKYFIDSIKLEDKKFFHPKLFLAVNKKQIRILIGSNNLTYKGYKKNAELIVSIVIDFESEENIELINDLSDYIEQIHNMVGNKYKKYIKKMSTTIDKYKKKFTEKGEKSAWLLHNIDKPFLNQIKNIIRNNILEIYVISPFFSQDKNFYEDFLKTCSNINIIIQQGKNTLPKDLLGDLNEINFYQLIINERFLHSKFIFFRTAEKKYYFCTSANFTRPALLSNENIESGILSTTDLSLKEFVERMGGLREIKLNEIETMKQRIENEVEKIDFSIAEAYRKENNLIIKLSEDFNLNNGKFRLYLNDENKNFNYEQEGEFIKFEIPDNEEELLEKSLVVKLVFKNDTGEKYSDYRLVKNQQIFPEHLNFLNSYDVNDSNYFYKILNKIVNLPKPEPIKDIPFIEVLELLVEEEVFNFIFPELEIVKLKKMLAKKSTSKSESKNESNNTSKKRLDLSSIIKKILNKYQKRIDTAIKKQDANNVISNIKSFIFTNKSILWAIKNDKNYSIRKLSKIRINIKKFFEDYLPIIYKKGNSKLIENRLLKYHLLVQTFIIHYLQTKSGEFEPSSRMGYNTVKYVFEKTTISALYYICSYEGFNFSDKVILDVLNEYGVIFNEILKVKPKSIISNINYLASKLSQQGELKKHKFILKKTNSN